MRSLDRGARGAPATAVAGASWRPLLSGPLRDQALETVDRLVHDLDRWDGHAGPDASLSTGAAGMAVCSAALARAAGDRRAGELADMRLDEAVAALGSARMAPSLFAGFTGIAWAAELVDRLLDEEDEDRNDEIDQALAGWISRYDGDDLPYDLIHGLTGLGAYALARWPRPGAVRCLAGVVDQLGRRARHDEAGTCWWTSPALLQGPRRTQHPDGGVDLGVAHGIAGVIPLLARIRVLEPAIDQAGPLLDGAVRWLSAHVTDTPSDPVLPAFVPAGSRPGPSRTAWCYGSPGVSAALLLAALDTGRPAWRELAVSLALESAGRPLERTGVTDAGFCHGSAGVAHLFNRLSQLTGMSRFEDAARHWFEHTLQACSVPLREGPSPASVPVPWQGAGVLEGAAGVALALLAACTDDEPVWDRMFLVASPAPAGVPG